MKHFTFSTLLVAALGMCVVQASANAPEHVFSVSATEVATLAGGNLQYDGSSYSFAAKQTNVMGTSNFTSGPRDLFQWSEVVDGSDNPKTFTIGGQTWKLLTKDQLSYLFNDRPRHNSLYGQGRIEVPNNQFVNGLILLPDDWQTPSGLAFDPLWDGSQGYERNSYSATDWGRMESAGATFLPCGGYGYNEIFADESGTWVGHGKYCPAAVPNLTEAERK